LGLTISDLVFIEVFRDLIDESLKIDLVIDRRDQVINICEVKFTTTPYSINKAYAANLQNKVATFKAETCTRKAIHLTLLTTYGLKNNTYLHSLVQNDLNMDIFFD